MDNELEFSVNQDLLKLQRYLNYELSSSVLFIFSFFNGIFIFLLSIAAVVFTPFMLYVLIKEKRREWIISFGIIVFIPACIMLVSSIFYTYVSLMLQILLGLFYLYCFVLRFEVNNWVSEIRAHNQYLIEKKRREEEAKVYYPQA